MQQKIDPVIIASYLEAEHVARRWVISTHLEPEVWLRQNHDHYGVPAHPRTGCSLAGAVEPHVFDFIIHIARICELAPKLRWIQASSARVRMHQTLSSCHCTNHISRSRVFRARPLAKFCIYGYVDALQKYPMVQCSATAWLGILLQKNRC